MWRISDKWRILDFLLYIQVIQLRRILLFYLCIIAIRQSKLLCILSMKVLLVGIFIPLESGPQEYLVGDHCCINGLLFLSKYIILSLDQI